MSSTGSIPPPNPLSYTGQVVVPFIMRTFSPQTTFNQFPVPTIWINTQAEIAYILVSVALGVATWVNLGGASGNLDTITTPDSVVVTPSAGNINFLESGSISITGSGNNISFTAMGGGFTWVTVTGTTQTLAANTAYIADNGAGVTFTLPLTAAVGDTYKVLWKAAGGWTIAQNAGQIIYYGDIATTLGVTGTLTPKPNEMRSVLEIVCITANTEFQVLSFVGNVDYT